MNSFVLWQGWKTWPTNKFFLSIKNSEKIVEKKISVRSGKAKRQTGDTKIIVINRTLPLFQTAAAREGHWCAHAANRGAALPPPQLPAVRPLGWAAEWEWGRLGLSGPGSLFTLVPAGHLHLDGSGRISPLPAPSQSLQHLRQEVPAQTQLGGMGWVDSGWDSVSVKCWSCMILLSQYSVNKSEKL